MDEFDYDLDSSLLQSKTIKVLLVDDQTMIAEGIRQMLEDEKDIEFHYCQDPAEAISTANAIQPSVILQDLVMPDIDGITLVRFYRNNEPTSETPIIVLSSKDDPSVKRDAFQTGASDYLVKLPDKIELIARIRSQAKQYMLQLERNAAFFALREMQKQLQQTNNELKRLSSLDGLTGIANRRTFDERYDQEWLRANREQSFLSLILVDIDFFKAYNDTYGHLMGDDCLQQVARSLKETATRPGDLAARYGGEEYAIIAPHTDESGAIKLANKIKNAIHDLNIEHSASEVSDRISVSIGVVSLIPDNNNKPEDAIHYADLALYQAKNNGRNSYITYNPDDHQ